MKILIFGGSFDPPHAGHKKLLSDAIKRVRPDVVHIVPAFQSPFKEISPTPFAARMKMAKAMFGDVTYDDFEFLKGRKTYSWEVIKYIKNLYPGAELFFLTGADCDVKTWKNPGYILKNAAIISGRRTKISSSEIRLKIMLSGAGAPGGLYYQNIHKWLKKHLKPARYAHTLAVAKLAAELAGIYNVNKERAALCALLHDAGKGVDCLKYARKHKVPAPDFELMARYAPELLHSYVSADIARRKFAITDENLLKAVAAHTLGAEHMDTLAQILYVADAAGPDRKYKTAAQIRALAFKDLRSAMVDATRMKLEHSLKASKWLAPEGNRTWNRLILKKD